MHKIVETPDIEPLLSGFSESAKNLMPTQTLSLVNKLFKRRFDIWAQLSSQASVNAQDKDIRKDLDRVFSPTIRMSKFIIALQTIYPSLPEEECMKVYKLFKFITWRRGQPFPLP